MDYCERAVRERKQRQDKHSSAYHESGHCFWIWLTGGRIKSIEVAVQKDVNGKFLSGLVKCWHPGLDPSKLWHDVDVLNLVKVNLAGLCCQYRAESEPFDPDFSGKDDIVSSMAHLVMRGWGGSNGKRWIDYDLGDFFFEFSGGEDGPRRLVYDSDIWGCIKALAGELLTRGKLSGQEAVQIILDNWEGPLPEKALPLEQHRNNDKEDNQ